MSLGDQRLEGLSVLHSHCHPRCYHGSYCHLRCRRILRPVGLVMAFDWSKSWPFGRMDQSKVQLTTVFVPRANNQNPTHIKWDSVQLVPPLSKL